MSKGLSVEGETDVQGFLLVLQNLWRHLGNWAEIYLWVPVSLIGIFAAAELTYFLTGRRPVENADWLVDYSSKAVLMIAIIALTSIAKEALGYWQTPDFRVEHPWLATINTLSTLVIFITVTYVFLH